MATNSIQYIFEIIDRYSPALKKMNANTKRFKALIRKTNADLKKFQKRTKEIGKSLTKTGKTMATKFSLPVALLIGLSVRASSKLEDMTTELQSITGSAEKAGKTINQLNKFTATTPFQLDQVVLSAKKLLSAGLEAKNLGDQLRILGDISSAFNKPLSAMARIFARVMEKTKASMEELNMLSEAGIPIIGALAKTLKVTKKQVFELSKKGLISFKIFKRALKGMTEESGVAFKATVRLSKTFSGLFSTFKDNIFLLSASIGDTILPDLKELTIKSIEIAQSLTKWSKENPKLIKMGLIIAGILAVVAPMLILLGQIALALTFLAGPAGIFILALGAIVIGVLLLINAWSKLKKKFTEKGFFVTVLSSIMSVTNAIIEAVTWVKNLIGTFSALAKVVSFNPIGKAFEFAKSFIGGTKDNNVNVGVDINLNDSKNAVKSINTTSNVNNVRKGKNMPNKGR